MAHIHFKLVAHILRGICIDLPTIKEKTISYGKTSADGSRGANVPEGVPLRETENSSQDGDERNHKYGPEQAILAFAACEQRGIRQRHTRWQRKVSVFHLAQGRGAG